jgi:hypothetical protein
VGELSYFASRYKLEIEPENDFYTFARLVNAPRYSIQTKPYIDPAAIASKTFEGNPWDVMRENNLVYDFTLDMVRPIVSITKKLQIQGALNYFFSDGLLLPGSINSLGQRVLSYSGYFASDGLQFRYSEVEYG